MAMLKILTPYFAPTTQNEDLYAFSGGDSLILEFLLVTNDICKNVN